MKVVVVLIEYLPLDSQLSNPFPSKPAWLSETNRSSEQNLSRDAKDMSNIIKKLKLFSSVAQSCPTLCDPMNRSTPGLPVHHQLLEFTQTQVHWVGDAIQPSHPLASPSPPALNPSQHQSFPMSQLFAWGGQSSGVSALASFLPKKSQGWSPLEWTGWSPCSPRGSQESSPTSQFKSINSSALSFLHSPTLTSIHDRWKNHSLD